MLNFRDCFESFKIDGDHLETMTDYEFNVHYSNPQDLRIFLLNKQDGKVTEINLLYKYLDRQRIGHLEFPQFFYHLILLNYVTD